MREERPLHISKKIFTVQDILVLYKAFYKEHILIKKKNASASLELLLLDEDGIKFWFDSPNEFESSYIPKRKRIVKITMSLSDDRYIHRAQISLTHGTDDLSNQGLIEGTDDRWISSFYNTISTIIEGVKPQFGLPYNSLAIIIIYLLLTPYFAYIVAYIIRPITYYALYNKIEFGNPPQLDSIIINMIGTVWIVKILIGKIWRLFPNIELQLGPDYKLLEKNRRKKLWLIFSILLLPILLMILEKYL